MNRVAIIVEQSLKNGEATNAAAILMGQISLDYPEIYSSKSLVDQSGFKHSGIACNVVILKTNKVQLFKLCVRISESEEYKKIKLIIFTDQGRLLSNNFNEYMNIISSNKLSDLIPISVSIAGENSIIRDLTKKYSLY